MKPVSDHGYAHRSKIILDSSLAIIHIVLFFIYFILLIKSLIISLIGNLYGYIFVINTLQAAGGSLQIKSLS